MRALPPNVALVFLLSSLASPAVTTRKSRAPTRSDKVLAIWPCVTPWPSAASATVAVLEESSMIAMSGACSARKARTDWTVIWIGLRRDFADHGRLALRHQHGSSHQRR